MSTLKVNKIVNLSDSSDVTNLGSFVKLQTTDASSSSIVSFTNSITDAFDTYEQYLIMFNKLRFSTDGITLRMRIINSSGEFSSNEYSTRVLETGGDGNHTGASSYRFNQVDIGNNSSGSLVYEDCSGYVYMTNFSNNFRHQIHGVVSYGDTSSNKRCNFFGGGVNENTATTGVNIFADTGNINSGKFTLYGVKQ
jgi:hypothetical protein|tara:strand:+ start:29 stop:613 length:585 start_codon:yes stop_codon:yes gene_type:complete